jgi:hypothetical protein
MKNLAESFKASAHSCGKIMGVKGLGKTGETALQEWVIKKRFNRRPKFFSKFVEKGLRVEDLGRDLLNELQGTNYTKNDEYFENDFTLGFPDIVENDIIIDIKSSWDIFSFPMFESELPNKDYYWQLQCYMAMSGVKKAAIAYCLIDTPQPLIEQELRKLYYQSGGHAEDWNPEVNQELAKNYKFDDIEKSERVKMFYVDYNEKAVELIKKRVLESREYLKSIL